MLLKKRIKNTSNKMQKFKTSKSFQFLKNLFDKN